MFAFLASYITHFFPGTLCRPELTCPCKRILNCLNLWLGILAGSTREMLWPELICAEHCWKIFLIFPLKQKKSFSPARKCSETALPELILHPPLLICYLRCTLKNNYPPAGTHFVYCIVKKSFFTLLFTENTVNFVIFLSLKVLWTLFELI
jgi:hypothetical protein